MDFCLSCHPSTNILPRSHLGLVRRLEDPMDLPLDMDPGSSGVDNGLPAVPIKLDIESTERK